MRTCRIIILVTFIGTLIPGCNNTNTRSKEPVDWVNQYMGNISHLLVPTYPTIHLPNSLLRVYPDRGDYTGSLLRGLPVVLTSHRGSFAFNISPFQGNVEGIKPVISYSYDLEKITPWSYSVFLDEQQIGVQFAPSHQAALYNMNFGSKATEVHVRHGISFIDENQAKRNMDREIRSYDIKPLLEEGRRIWNESLGKTTVEGGSGRPAGELDRFYKEHGYFPALREGEPEKVPGVNSFEKRQAVAVTLGTSYDEWCLSQIAKELGKTEEYSYFLKCSYNYRNLFNPETHFFHPKDSKGVFIQPFDYIFSGGFGTRDYYDENNGWTYRWDVQHNVADLIDLMGGKEAFVKNIDATFSEPLGKNKPTFYAQSPDQTGNVGQFSMGNEPSL